ncbi:MAG: hypothetical protein HY815_06325 [Candidatus Riflebacteria bacterium]|nr:hypothetical protein [Candidatus Riflebacteria bacterium]
MHMSALHGFVLAVCLVLIVRKVWLWWRGLGLVEARFAWPEGALAGLPGFGGAGPLRVGAVLPALATAAPPVRAHTPAAQGPDRGAGTPGSDGADEVTSGPRTVAAAPTSSAALQGPDRPDQAAPVRRDSGHGGARLVDELTELAQREVRSAKIRAQSILINAEEQARSIMAQGRCEALQATDPHPAVQSAAAQARVRESHLQGQKEGRALGLRIGKMKALARIEKVFHEIEQLLATRPARPAR